MLLTAIVRVARGIALPAAILGTLTLAACGERPREMQTAPRLKPSGPVLNTADGQATLDCPPRPNVTKRTVTAGAEADRNGNGIVCDEQMGGPADDRKLTTDDIALPQPATP